MFTYVEEPCVMDVLHDIHLPDVLCALHKPVDHVHKHVEGGQDGAHDHESLRCGDTRGGTSTHTNRWDLKQIKYTVSEN